MVSGRASGAITVRYFAAARDVVGVAVEEVAVADALGAAAVSIADVRALLLRLHPALSSVLVQSRLAVNQRFAADDVVVGAGDEVAVIPPVGGG